MPQNLGPQCFLVQSSKLMFRIYHHGVLTETTGMDHLTDRVTTQVTLSLTPELSERLLDPE